MFDAKSIRLGTEYEAAKWSADPVMFIEYRNGLNEDIPADDEQSWLTAGAQNIALAAEQKENTSELISLHQPQPMDEVMAEEIWRDMLVPGQEYLLELYN